MRFGRSGHFGFVLLVSAAFTLPAFTHAQNSQSQQDQSVADAARRSRDKKKSSSKSPKVITDDDLDRRNFTPGQEGLNVGSPPKSDSQPPDPAAVAAVEAADDAALKKATDEDAQIAKLKDQVAQAEKDLDLLRREFTLDSDVYYSKPDFANDKAGKANLDREQQQIAAKQQELEALKTRLAALQETQSRRKPARPKAAPNQNQKPANPPSPQT